MAAFPVHGASPEGLVHTADLSLYSAKQQGRDRVVMALPDPSS